VFIFAHPMLPHRTAIKTMPKGLLYEVKLMHNGKEKELYLDDQAATDQNKYED
jgi:hypothetical protein